MALFEKTSEIKFKKKQVFSTESNEQHQNLKRTKIITYMKEVAPSQHLALYAEVFCPKY
jgi:hypothetical protein